MTSCRVLGLWLAKFGLRCVAVTDRQQALDRLRYDEAFDAVILDLQLPGTNGLDLAEEIRQMPAGKSVRLLLLSSVHLRAGDPRAAALHLSPFVYKPIRPKQLLSALSQSFDQRFTRIESRP